MLEGMRRRTTAAVTAATSLLLGTGAAAVAAGRYASGTALRPAREPAGFRGPELLVHAASPGEVTLSRTVQSVRPGRYGLAGPGCRAIVGEVLGPDGGADTVVRHLEQVSEGELRPGSRVRLTPQLYAGEPFRALGISSAEVDIHTGLGPMPAWYLTGERDLWVILLHGLGTTREQAMNLMPFLRRHKLPLLVPSYRGDPGAPAPPGGLGRLGTTEWQDVDAAIRYAVRYGARRVLLLGWSVGGTMALRAAAQSGVRDRIAGMVLDSPVLDWRVTLRALAAERRVPAPLRPLLPGAARGRLGMPDASRVGLPAEADLPGRRMPPVLVFHGPGDTIAPWRASRELARRHPESVVLETVPDAQHAAMWNAAPGPYEERLRRFLTPLY